MEQRSSRGIVRLPVKQGVYNERESRQIEQPCDSKAAGG